MMAYASVDIVQSCKEHGLGRVCKIRLYKGDWDGSYEVITMLQVSHLSTFLHFLTLTFRGS